MKFASKLRLVLTIKCEQASRLSSESFERRLELHERIALSCHRAICWSCRHFAKQLELLRQAFSRLNEEEHQSLELGPELSPSAKLKLKGLRLTDSK